MLDTYKTIAVCSRNLWGGIYVSSGKNQPDTYQFFPDSRHALLFLSVVVKKQRSLMKSCQASSKNSYPTAIHRFPVQKASHIPQSANF